MSFRLSLALAAAFSLSACTTVDLNDVASPQASAQVKTTQANIVQRTASKLYTTFTNRGFVPKTGRKKMQSVARILLKGLQAKDVTSSSAVNYVDSAQDPVVIYQDIRMATTHVENTAKAAEVYLAMASIDTSLRKELSSLEKALIASREASLVFEEALEKLGVESNNIDYSAYKVAVNDLRDATNAFGHRVREDQIRNYSAIN